MRAVLLLATLVTVLAGCPDKKKQPPAAAGEGSTAPILRPVENKLDNSMKKSEDRTTPEPPESN